MIKDMKAETAEGNAPQNDLVTVTVQISSKDYVDMVNHFTSNFAGLSMGRPLVGVHKICDERDGEPTWMLETEAELVIRKVDDDTVFVRELNGGRACVLHITKEGRLTFNGIDIDTEQFIAYLGVMDEVICVNDVK